MKHFLAVLKGCYAVSRMLCLLFALVSVALTILTFTINPTRFDESITEPIFAGLPLAGTAVTILYSGSILVIMLCGHTHNARNDICVDLFGTLLNWIPSFMLMGLIGDFEMWYDLDWQKEIAMEAAVAFMGLFLGCVASSSIISTLALTTRSCVAWRILFSVA